MTNPEYEAACLTAAQCSLRFEGEHLRKQYDEIIAAAEANLSRLYEARREICNRYDLNKPESETGAMLKEKVINALVEAYRDQSN